MSEKPTLDLVREQTRQARREAFREAVLDAALSLFVEKGFREITMADVAEAAGVAKGTLYNYFEDKNEVFAEIAERSRQQFFAALDTSTAQLTGWERLSALVRAPLSFLETHARDLVVYVEATGFGENSTADPRQTTGRDAYIERLQVALRQLAERDEIAACEVEFYAHALEGMVNAALRTWLRQGHPRGLADDGDKIVELFTRGARTGAPR